MKDGFKAATAGVVGAGAGAATYSVIGGVGIAVSGTAVGITIGPFIAIGAGLGTSWLWFVLAWQTSRCKKIKIATNLTEYF